MFEVPASYDLLIINHKYEIDEIIKMININQ